MIKTFGLLLGALLAPLQPIDENEINRYEMKAHIRKMIGLPNLSIPPFTQRQLLATPKTFCTMILDDCHQELMQQFESVGIKLDDNQKIFLKKKRKLLDEDREHSLSDTETVASKRVKTVIQQLATRKGIDQEIIVLNSQDSTHLGTACAAQITFNEEQWEDYFDQNINVLTFIAGHELAHIYHEDAIKEEVIKELIEKISEPVKRFDAKRYLLRFSRFCEVRADIESNFKSKRALKGFSFWAERDIEIDGDTGGGSSSHPLTSERLRLAGLLKKLRDTYKPQPRKYKAKQ